MPSDFRLVPATREHALAFWGGEPPFSFRGFAGLIGDEVVGVMGVHFAGDRFWAFSGWIKERVSPRMRVLAIREMVRYMDEQKIPLYATADKDHASAVDLLFKLGFVPTGELLEDAEIMVRRSKCLS